MLNIAEDAYGFGALCIPHAWCHVVGGRSRDTGCCYQSRHAIHRVSNGISAITSDIRSPRTATRTLARWKSRGA